MLSVEQSLRTRYVHNLNNIARARIPLPPSCVNLRQVKNLNVPRPQTICDWSDSFNCKVLLTTRFDRKNKFQRFVTHFYRTKMTVEVYGDISSAPTRLVLMTCECLELDYNFNTVSLLNGEHKLPEYTKVKVFP